MPAERYPDTVYLDACERIANGELVEDAARAAGCTGTSLRDWAKRADANAATYARARLVSASTLEEEILTLARSVTPETYAADNVRINTLKWVAGKRNPREYGDKQNVEHTINVGTLHLEALQAPRTTATARIAQPVTVQHDTIISDASGGDVDTVAD